MFADEYDSGACSELYSWRVVKPRLKVASCPSASMSVASELICQHPDFQDFKENPRDRASYILWISKHKNELVNMAKHLMTWHVFLGYSNPHTFKTWKTHEKEK